MNLLRKFSQPNIERWEAQNLIKRLTNELLKQFFKDRHEASNSETTLIPILRAGLPMWVEANDYFKTHESSFISCFRIKGTSDVFINWLSQPKLERREVILLDTVLATGKTIFEVCKKINNPNKVSSLDVIACYTSPRAIDFLMTSDYLRNMYIGVISTSVDNAGFLVPLTNGDSGDKCFGETTNRN